MKWSNDVAWAHGLRMLLLATLPLTPGAQVWALDRDEALSALQESRYFPRHYLVELPIGSVAIRVLIPAAMAANEYRGNEINTGYACAEKLGYLRIQPDNDYVLKGLRDNVTVTPIGESHGWTVAKESGGYSKHYVFPAVEYSPKRITGIKMIDAVNALVEFDYGVSEVLEAGRCLWKNIDNRKGELEFKGRATLGKYDDGWRVESAQGIGLYTNEWSDLEPASRRLKVSSSPARSSTTGSASSSTSASPGVPTNQAYRNCLSVENPEAFCAQQYPDKVSPSAGTASSAAGAAGTSGASAPQVSTATDPVAGTWVGEIRWGIMGFDAIITVERVNSGQVAGRADYVDGSRPPDSPLYLYCASELILRDVGRGTYTFKERKIDSGANSTCPIQGLIRLATDGGANAEAELARESSPYKVKYKGVLQRQ